MVGVREDLSHAPTLVQTCLICIPEPSEYSPELVTRTGNQPLPAALHAGRRPDQVSNRHQIRSLVALFRLILIAEECHYHLCNALSYFKDYIYVKNKNGMQFLKNMQRSIQSSSCCGCIKTLPKFEPINKQTYVLSAELFKWSTKSQCTFPNS